MKFILSLIFSCLISIQLFSQTNTLDNWKITGYSQIIPYADGRDFNHNTYAPIYTIMKTRVGVSTSIGDKVDFVFKLQDSRIFGEYEAVTTRTPTTYLFEGYVRFNNILSLPLSVKAGRFQVGKANERFLGPSSWSYTERAYDGILFNYAREKHSLDLFALKYSSVFKTQHIPPQGPNTLPHIAEPYSDRDILGFWYTNDVVDNHTFHLFWYWDKNNKKSDTLNKDLDMHTLGYTYLGKFGKFRPVSDFAFQTGTKSNLDIAAYFFSLKLNYDATENIVVTAAADLHSGTAHDETEKWNTFDNQYGSKHSYLGYMDYFGGIRTAYGGIGVNDFYIGGAYTTDDKKWFFNLIAHYFMSNKENALGNSDYGTEFDLVIRYNVIKGAFVEWGGGIFLPGELMKNIYELDGKVRQDPSFISYLRFYVNI